MEKTGFKLECLQRNGKYPWELSKHEFCADGANKYVGLGRGCDEIYKYIWNHLNPKYLHFVCKKVKFIHPGIYMEPKEAQLWKEIDSLYNTLGYGYYQDNGIWFQNGFKVNKVRVEQLNLLKRFLDEKTQFQLEVDQRIMPEAHDKWCKWTVENQNIRKIK